LRVEINASDDRQLVVVLQTHEKPGFKNLRHLGFAFLDRGSLSPKALAWRHGREVTTVLHLLKLREFHRGSDVGCDHEGILMCGEK
jgi:hypothetical protein